MGVSQGADQKDLSKILSWVSRGSSSASQSEKTSRLTGIWWNKMALQHQQLQVVGGEEEGDQDGDVEEGRPPWPPPWVNLPQAWLWNICENNIGWCYWSNGPRLQSWPTRPCLPKFCSEKSCLSETKEKGSLANCIKAIYGTTLGLGLIMEELLYKRAFQIWPVWIDVKSVWCLDWALLAPKVLLKDLWPVITIHPIQSPTHIYTALKTTSHVLR